MRAGPGAGVISYLIRSFLGQVIGFLQLLCSDLLWGHLTFVPGGAGQAKAEGRKEERVRSEAPSHPEDMWREGPAQENTLFKKRQSMDSC